MAQDDVTAQGNCDAVGQAAAPPIIAITAQQTGPGAPPAPGGGQPTSGGGIYVTLPDWQNQLPAPIRAPGPESARLVAYVSPTLTTVQNCGDYRNRVDYVVRVALAATGATVDQRVIQGGEPPACPPSILVNSTLNGPPPPLSAALGWFEELLAQH